ncbi:Crp/Fnr family transcriptional regulator [Methylomonas methanica]|uniref:Transcriptional regulator, Crp/Fnr family n=1 Tax=Methylomonas methanica (strain DSM 25384 / MC09) TaxID=857087 RepID=G0A6R7_METMM|nr:Crp/Fnr family transcriptional regulator [Methylomonas methanica]AEG00538.1 transcriptional regulator, Crp/Fnr family [Methylomonas methanica MC09]
MLQPDYSRLLLRCSECGKINRCLACALIGDQLRPTDSTPLQNLIQPKGHYIYNQGDEIKNLFFLKAGSVKNIYTNKRGDQQIINFYFPGEVIGLPQLQHSHHSSSAVTLEKSVICSFSLRFILANCEGNPHLLNTVLERFDAEIQHRHESLLAINHRSAGKRLADFLLELIYRHDLSRNYPILLSLTMSRADIANYLGLAPETISRILSKYEKSGLILVNKKKIQINNLNDLSACLE